MSCSKCVYNPFHQLIRNGGENVCPDAFTAVSAYCGYNQDNREPLSDVQSERGGRGMKVSERIEELQTEITKLAEKYCDYCQEYSCEDCVIEYKMLEE